MSKHSFVQASLAPVPVPNFNQAFGWIGEMRRNQRAERLAALQEQRLRLQMERDRQAADLQRQKFALEQQKYNDEKAQRAAALRASLIPAPTFNVDPYTTETVEVPDRTKEVVEADAVNQAYNSGVLPTVQQYMPKDPGVELDEQDKKYQIFAQGWNEIQNAKWNSPEEKRLAEIKYLKSVKLNTEPDGAEEYGVGDKIAATGLKAATYPAASMLLLSKPFLDDETYAERRLNLRKGWDAANQVTQDPYEKIKKRLESVSGKQQKLSEYEKLKEEGRKKYETEIQKFLKESGMIKPGTKKKDVQAVKDLASVYSDIDTKLNAHIRDLVNRKDLDLAAKAAMAQRAREQANATKATLMSSIYKPMIESNTYKMKKDIDYQNNAKLKQIEYQLKAANKRMEELMKSNSPKSQLELKKIKKEIARLESQRRLNTIRAKKIKKEIE